MSVVRSHKAFNKNNNLSPGQEEFLSSQPYTCLGLPAWTPGRNQLISFQLASGNIWKERESKKMPILVGPITEFIIEMNRTSMSTREPCVTDFRLDTWGTWSLCQYIK